jgi:hypothetical protein
VFESRLSHGCLFLYLRCFVVLVQFCANEYEAGTLSYRDLILLEYKVKQNLAFKIGFYIFLQCNIIMEP